jgi:hypothetical protein
VLPALALVLPVPVAATDGGEAERVLLWNCDDGSLAGTGFPGCEEVAQALRIEMEGVSLSIVDLDSGGTVPLDLKAETASRGALFLAWVAPGNGSYVLFAYDALNDQVVSKTVVAGSVEPPDAAAVAFLYRNMLGTSLYSDLETIETDSELWSLVFPREKVKVVSKVEGIEPAAPGPTRVRLALGYGLNGYPLGSAAWHEISMGLAVRVHRLVDVGFDLGVTPAAALFSEAGVKLAVHLVAARAGVWLRAVDREPFLLLPGAGFCVAASLVHIDGGIDPVGRAHTTSWHGTAWASVLLMLMMHRNVGLGLELGAEVLFNYQTYEVGEDDREILSVGGLGLFLRFGFVFAL